MRHLAVLVLAAALSVAAGIASAATVVGMVSRAQGPCDGESEGQKRQLAADAPVHLLEVISTGRGGRLEITFDDGTRLTLGERARLVIDRFVYTAAGPGNAIQLSARGAFRFVSGSLTKTAGASATMVTPLATIGIRGTDFWGGPIDGEYGVFLLEGSVAVATGDGESVLAAPGEGVSIRPPPPPLRGSAPSTQQPVRGPVIQWSPDKAARAIAAVSFN